MASAPMRRGDLYQVLGVAAAASSDEITAAFRAQAKQLHPDRNPGDHGAAERFKELTLAYQTLVRPRSRDAYDRRHHPPGRSTPAPTATNPVKPDPIFRTPRRARAAVVSGVALFVLGVALAVVLVLIDTGDVGETVTLWVAATKLVLGGPILAGAGLFRLRRFATAR
jgi:preprotein translocase subunit Sec63